MPRAGLDSQDFVELKAGWRVKVVVPILRSGGYFLSSIKNSDNQSSEIKAADEFIGVETAYYDIVSRPDSGIKIRFSRAEVLENGKTRTVSRPRLSPLDDLSEARYVRLVYLTRESCADHEMAIVASKERSSLEAVTLAVSNGAVCQNDSASSCIWVPAGIAVTPEERAVVNRKREWIPARSL